MQGSDSLVAVTGLTGGSEYATKVNSVQASKTTFEAKPSLPHQNGPLGTLFRPLNSMAMTGME
jgi:hypothetical protein